MSISLLVFISIFIILTTAQLDLSTKLDRQVDDIYYKYDDFSVEAPEDYDEEAQAVLEQAPFIKQKTTYMY